MAGSGGEHAKSLCTHMISSNISPVAHARRGAGSSTAASSSGGRGISPAERCTRLDVLIQLRKLYRNLLRSELLLKHPSPVYQPLEEGAAIASSNSAGSSSSGASNVASSSSSSSSEGGEGISASQEAEAEQRIAEAVETVAEMELTADELKVCPINFLPASPCNFACPSSSPSDHSYRLQLHHHLPQAPPTPSYPR